MSTEGSSQVRDVLDAKGVAVAGGGAVGFSVAVAGGGAVGFSVAVAGGGTVGFSVAVAGGGTVGLSVAVAGGGDVGRSVGVLDSKRVFVAEGVAVLAAVGVNVLVTGGVVGTFVRVADDNTGVPLAPSVAEKVGVEAGLAGRGLNTQVRSCE